MLSYLAARGTSTQRDIAVYFAVDAAAVSRMLDTLARKGMVTVAPAETDRRAKAVTLTEAGHETVRAWDERCAEVEQIMLDGIDEADRAQLEELLERVRANLVAARRGRDAALRQLAPGQREGRRARMSDLKLILRYLGPYRRDFVLAAICMVLEGTLELMIPFLHRGPHRPGYRGARPLQRLGNRRAHARLRRRGHGLWHGLLALLGPRGHGPGRQPARCPVRGGAAPVV